MAENERIRTRERAAPNLDSYERQLRARAKFQDRQLVGQVVIRSTDREFTLTRHANLKFYLAPETFQDTPLQAWLVFVTAVKRHSGKHRHQGGLVIYVIEGRGYSVVDDERIEWEAGDLLLLPIKPEGVVHQHFNHAPGEPCLWIAFLYLPIMDHVSMEMTQIEVMPEFKER